MVLRKDFAIYSAALVSCVLMIILLMTSNSISYNLTDAVDPNKDYLVPTKVDLKQPGNESFNTAMDDRGGGAVHESSSGTSSLIATNSSETDEEGTEIDRIIIEILLKQDSIPEVPKASPRKQDTILEVYPDNKPPRTAARSEPPSGKTEGYRVRVGDTLSGIASRQGVEVSDLVHWNNIRNAARIYPGQVLMVRKSSSGSSDPVQFAHMEPGVSPEKARLPAPSSQSFLWPTPSTKISSDYGMRHDPFHPEKLVFHPALDISAHWGDPVFATKDGEVAFVGRRNGYGNMVIIRHPDGFLSVYGHNSANLVRHGQSVRQGQTIAKVGSTGRSTAPHLHFEIRKYTRPINPMSFLNGHIAREDRNTIETP
jgi:LysM repeat protein